MSDIKVKFRGVRGSFPVADRSFLQFGGNTSCVEIKIKDETIILDAGTGIVSAGNDMMEENISSSPIVENREPIKTNILISHIHQDHLLGLAFFKPLHLKTSNIRIFGSTFVDVNMKEALSTLVFGKTFPIELGEIACKLDIQDIDNAKGIIIKPKCDAQLIFDEEIHPDEEDILITFYKSYVHPKDGVMIYKISYKNKSVVYATDKECYMGGDKKFAKFAKNCDILIHDSQYTAEDYLNPYSPKQGFGHSTFDMAIEAMKQTEAKNLVFFHYEPSYDDAKLSAIKERYASEYKNVYMSYEGFELEI